jgi:hypothetical protein
MLVVLELLGILSSINWPTWFGLVLRPSESTVTAVGLATAGVGVGVGEVRAWGVDTFEDEYPGGGSERGISCGVSRGMFSYPGGLFGGISSSSIISGLLPALASMPGEPVRLVVDTCRRESPAISDSAEPRLELGSLVDAPSVFIVSRLRTELPLRSRR